MDVSIHLQCGTCSTLRSGRRYESRAFLEAFRRFMARRGKPNKIISDNATLLKLQGIQSILLGMTSPATVKYTAILAKIALNGNSLQNFLLGWDDSTKDLWE